MTDNLNGLLVAVCQDAIYEYGLEYGEVMHLVESILLEQLLIKHKFNVSKLARNSGLSRATIRTRLKEHFGDKYFRDAE